MIPSAQHFEFPNGRANAFEALHRYQLQSLAFMARVLTHSKLPCSPEGARNRRIENPNS